MAIPSYGKIFNLGHRAISQLFDGGYVVQEKIDGSYFAFGILDGRLQARSKGQLLDLDAPDKMFIEGVETVKRLADKLTPGWVYCGEYLRRPKHNTLAYDRVPKQHVILFDIETEPGTEKFLMQDELFEEAAGLDLEVVPYFCNYGPDELDRVFEWTSILGGQKVEGVVIKNYSRFGIDGHMLRGKHVSPAFKEVHNQSWKERNPAGRDIKQELALAYRTPARWNKAIQHLRDAGALTDSPQDIGALLKEINTDVLAECGDEIKERLFKWAWKDLSRELTKGFPEYYKQLLSNETE